jgi:hypothetical protein
MAPKGSKANKPDKGKKLGRPKMVRDSFTMPEDDYSKLKTLKTRCLNLGIEIKKSELLRAGLLALESLDDTELQAIAAKIEKIKTGRPPK